jgi:hypothetical protein
MIRIAMLLMGGALACAVVGFSDLYESFAEAGRWGLVASLVLAGFALLVDRPRLAADVE